MKRRSTRDHQGQKGSVRSSTVREVFDAIRTGDRKQLEVLFEDLVTRGCTYEQLATLVEDDDEFERYPVHIAAVMGHVDCLRFLLGPVFGAAFASRVAGTPRELNEFFRCGRDGTPLHNAVDAGQYNAVRFLVEELGCDPCHVLAENWGAHCLHFACQGGSLRLVKYFLSEYPATMLHTQEEKAEYWTKMNPKSHNMYVVWSPLHYACASVWKHHRFDDENNRERIEIVRLLVGEPYNCDPNRAERYQHYTPLLAVAEHGHVSMIRFLVEELKCDFEVREGSQDLNALEIACKLNTACPKKTNRRRDGRDDDAEFDEKEANHIEIIRYLVGDLKLCPVKGSALSSLTITDKIYATRMLLGGHPNDEEDEALLVGSSDYPRCRVQRTSQQGYQANSLPITLLESSTVSADYLANLLLIWTVSPRMSLLHFKHLVAMERFHSVSSRLGGIKATDVDLAILKWGCAFAFPRIYFQTLASYSCQEGIFGTDMMERKVDLNLKTARDSAGQSILHRVMRDGVYRIDGKDTDVATAIDSLCRNFGCDVNARDATGRVPLHFACSRPARHSVTHVAKLLEWGADVNSLCASMGGAKSGNGNGVTVSHWMDLESRRELGLTPLQMIVIPSAGDLYRSADCDPTAKLVQLLLDTGADVNAASILHQECRTAFELCDTTVVRERWGTPLDLCDEPDSPLAGSCRAVQEILHAEGAKRIAEIVPEITRTKGGTK